jgi:hypothetical protein
VPCAVAHPTALMRRETQSPIKVVDAVIARLDRAIQ